MVGRRVANTVPRCARSVGDCDLPVPHGEQIPAAAEIHAVLGVFCQIKPDDQFSVGIDLRVFRALSAAE